MAGAQASDLAIAVARGGGLGAIPCALLSPDAVREHVHRFRAATKELSAPINLNFFCHTLPPSNPKTDKQWQNILEPYYREYGVDLSQLTVKGALRMPFDELSLELVRELKPEVVSFHFGLPSSHMLQGVKDTAGGIGDARGILAASALGAAAVQMGTVFLLADETQTSNLHRNMLKRAAIATREEALETAITNVFSGRPARGFITRVMRELGPMCAEAPEFPTAGAPLGALKKAAEAKGDTAFSSLWSGQSPGFAQEKSAEVIMRSLVKELDLLVAQVKGAHSSL
ncbi:2-nitropropane dioxygenase [Phytophthora palmivora]|uniref:2-nitropropane dioxygenase n=1 Tax=Phytophthora palmivora TaxID=4796 RepID=A0A2P4XSP0_9STRA|nr:2-nitropropane dioxygenase [Phytophthora palmivora]